MAKKKKNSKSQKNSSNAKIKAAYTKVNNAKKKAQARQNKALKAQLLYEKNEKKRLKKKEKKAIKNGSKGDVFGAFGSVIKFSLRDPYNEKKKFRYVAPDEIKREVQGRWTSYNLLGRKPLKSFMGPDSSSLTIPITLSSQHGINPRAMLETIRKAIEKGTVDYLVIGGKTIGGVRYYIESMSETWENFFKGGKLIQASCELHFVEYH